MNKKKVDILGEPPKDDLQKKAVKKEKNQKVVEETKIIGDD